MSGNGQLSAHKDSAIHSLNIFLVSADTKMNVSVATDGSFLEGEEGSTVKHLDWPVSACIAAGKYNVRRVSRQPRSLLTSS